MLIFVFVFGMVGRVACSEPKLGHRRQGLTKDNFEHVGLRPMCVVHAKRDACLLFQEHPVPLRTFVMQLKSVGKFSPMKPRPLQDADLKHCAESAKCGSVTMLYGRLISYIKHLHGVRNTVFPEWKWGHIQFVPTLFHCKATGREEVRKGRKMSCGHHIYVVHRGLHARRMSLRGATNPWSVQMQCMCVSCRRCKCTTTRFKSNTVTAPHTCK